MKTLKFKDFNVVPPAPFYLNFVDAVAFDEDGDVISTVQRGVVDSNGDHYEEKHPDRRVVDLYDLESGDLEKWNKEMIELACFEVIRLLNVDSYPEKIFEREFELDREKSYFYDMMLHYINENINSINFNCQFAGCIAQGSY